MRKMIYAVMAIASLTYSTHTTAQSQDLQKEVNAYFEQSLQAQQKALEQDGRQASLRTLRLTLSFRQQ